MGAPTAYAPGITSNTFTTQINKTIHILSTTVGIDAKTVANTQIYTAPTTLNTIVTAAIIRCTLATAITVGPTVGIGSASGTSDIFAATALTALITTTTIFGYGEIGISVTIPPSTGTVFVNVTNAATGTAQTISVDLLGYLI